MINCDITSFNTRFLKNYFNIFIYSSNIENLTLENKNNYNIEINDCNKLLVINSLYKIDNIRINNCNNLMLLNIVSKIKLLTIKDTFLEKLFSKKKLNNLVLINSFIKNIINLDIKNLLLLNINNINKIIISNVFLIIIINSCFNEFHVINTKFIKILNDNELSEIFYENNKITNNINHTYIKYFCIIESNNIYLSNCDILKLRIDSKKINNIQLYNLNLKTFIINCDNNNFFKLSKVINLKKLLIFGFTKKLLIDNCDLDEIVLNNYIKNINFDYNYFLIVKRLNYKHHNKILDNNSKLLSNKKTVITINNCNKLLSFKSNLNYYFKSISNTPIQFFKMYDFEILKHDSNISCEECKKLIINDKDFIKLNCICRYHLSCFYKIKNV